MATYEKLRKLFTDLTLATIATHAAACTLREPIDRTGFEQTSCESDMLLAAATPAVAVDYLAIRRIAVSQADVDIDDLPAPEIETEVGMACATAADGVACETTLASWPSSEGFHDEDEFILGLLWISGYQLMYTRGDEVGVITNAEELRAFLGTIDRPEEAMLIARFAEGHTPSCGPNTRVTDAGIEVLTTNGAACGEGTSRSEHVLVIAPDGAATIRRSVVVAVGSGTCSIGRLTDGIATRATTATEVGDWLAEMAHLEACAVFAFMRLSDELDALGAPADLVARARIAADDETRHAREVADLAIMFGGVVEEIADVPVLPLRGAFAVALENASEGCVRETYGALVATHQARTASDARVRAVLARIAADETNHAAFSWDLARWLDGLLDASQRTHVADERARAVARFRDARDHALSRDGRVTVGLPDDATSRALFAGLEASVWA